MEKTVSLASLKKGEHFRINRVTHAREVGKKLADMGFTRGTPGVVVRSALLHDPIEIRILGYNVSIRRAEAAGISVDRILPDAPVKSPKGKG
jgi:ferrous iron transport protein A